MNEQNDPKNNLSAVRALVQDLQSNLISSRVENPETYRYILYTRKSTDEPSKQARSLSDQLVECKELAELLKLRITKVIAESESAKEPDIRKKFRSMIDMIEAGKAEGILAWHPDRLARNMREAGEIVDLLDKRIIKDLKFKSFTFENTPSGKMLLGISFVLSKQFSDQLSENIKRGNRRSVEEGRYLSTAKHGYYRDRDLMQWPDGQNFVLVKDAFRMRLENKSLQEIADYMNRHDYRRQNRARTRREIYKMNQKEVSDMLRDPFYCGALVYGTSIVNLPEQYGFTPVISVEQFNKLTKKDAISKNFKLTKRSVSGGEKLAALLNGMVICAYCSHLMYPNINKKKVGQKINRRFYLRCDQKGCKQYGKSTRAKVIVGFVKALLADNPFATKAAYSHYKTEMKRLAAKKVTEERQELKSSTAFLREELKRRSRTLEALKGTDDLEVKKLFEQEISQRSHRIERLEEGIDQQKEILKQNPDNILEFQKFFELMQKLPQLIEKTTVMKELDEILRQIFVNFTIENKKVASYSLKSPFKELFEASKATTLSSGGDGGN